jgi:hypothetical protein
MDVVAWDDRLKVVRPSTLLHKLHMHKLMSLCLQPQLTGANANCGYSQSFIPTYTATILTKTTIVKNPQHVALVACMIAVLCNRAVEL